MEKAYYRIEWGFLEQTLVIMGFLSKMIRTIILCISSLNFSILINGHPSQYFTPTRGIRQGDSLPISLLFVQMFYHICLIKVNERKVFMA